MSINQPTEGKPTVLGIVLHYNPHVIPIFDELYQRPDIHFTGCVLETSPSNRVAVGWRDFSEDQPYLQPWRGPEHRAHYHRVTQEADIVIWPGLAHPHGLRLIHKRVRKGKPNILMSEPFIQLFHRPWYKRLGIRLIVGLTNSPNVHLFAIGKGTCEDYRRYGAPRWPCWRYGYAVRPVVSLDYDLTPAPEGTLRLLFVGELTERKAVHILLQALGRPRLAGKPWILTIVGDGPERQGLARLAGELNIAGQVEFKGIVHCDQMRGVYARTDVLVLPSRFDGWGAVVNEAMEHGLAIVASDRAGSAYTLVREGIDGFIYPYNEPEALADCLDQLIRDPARCASMRRSCRKRIEQFRPAVYAERTAAICRWLAGYGPMPHYEEGICERLP